MFQKSTTSFRCSFAYQILAANKTGSEGEIFDAFYETISGVEDEGDSEASDYVDISFLDSRDHNFTIEYISPRPTDLLKNSKGETVTEDEIHNEAYQVKRIFRHIFEKEELVGYNPLHVNADFLHSISPKKVPGMLVNRAKFDSLLKPVKRRACAFIVSGSPIEGYEDEKYSLDNRELLKSHYDSDFMETFKDELIFDNSGRKALLLSTCYKNLAIGFFNFVDCEQDSFFHQNRFFYRVKFAPFEKFLTNQKKMFGK